MSNDRAEERIKEKISNSERKNTVSPQLTGDLWARLEAKEAIKPVRGKQVVFIKAAAALLILAGTLLLFMQRHGATTMVYQKEPPAPLSVTPAAPDCGNTPTPGIATTRQSDDGKTKPGRSKHEAKRRPNTIAIARVVKQLENVEDPLTSARLQIAMIDVSASQVEIKDKIEF